MGLNWIPTSKNWYNPKYMGLITVNIIWFLWYNQNFPGVEASKILGTILFQSLRASAGGLQDTHGPKFHWLSTVWRNPLPPGIREESISILCANVSYLLLQVNLFHQYEWLSLRTYGDLVELPGCGKGNSLKKLNTASKKATKSWKLLHHCGFWIGNFTLTPQKKMGPFTLFNLPNLWQLGLWGGIPIRNLHRIRGIKTCFFE